MGDGTARGLVDDVLAAFESLLTRTRRLEEIVDLLSSEAVPVHREGLTAEFQDHLEEILREFQDLVIRVAGGEGKV